jgi:hypothetical protein
MYIHRGTIGLYVTVFSLPMSKCAVSVVCSWGQVILCILTKWHRVKLPSSMEYRGLCTQRFGDGADSAGSLHFLAFCDGSALKTASARPGGLPSRRVSTFKRLLNGAIERCGSVDLAEQERKKGDSTRQCVRHLRRLGVLSTIRIHASSHRVVSILVNLSTSIKRRNQRGQRRPHLHRSPSRFEKWAPSFKI